MTTLKLGTYKGAPTKVTYWDKTLQQPNAWLAARERAKTEITTKEV